MSFRAYLKIRPLTADAAGAFASKAIGDVGLPKFATWSQLEEYLRNPNFSKADIEGARHIWGEYIHKQKRHRTRRS